MAAVELANLSDGLDIDRHYYERPAQLHKRIPASRRRADVEQSAPLLVEVPHDQDAGDNEPLLVLGQPPQPLNGEEDQLLRPENMTIFTAPSDEIRARSRVFECFLAFLLPADFVLVLVLFIESQYSRAVSSRVAGVAFAATVSILLLGCLIFFCFLFSSKILRISDRHALATWSTHQHFPRSAVCRCSSLTTPNLFHSSILALHRSTCDR